MKKGKPFAFANENYWRFWGLVERYSHIRHDRADRDFLSCWHLPIARLHQLERDFRARRFTTYTIVIYHIDNWCQCHDETKLVSMVLQESWKCQSGSEMLIIPFFKVIQGVRVQNEANETKATIAQWYISYVISHVP